MMKVPKFDGGQWQYQLLPPLSQDEFNALYESIKAQGVLVPVELDEAGNLLDGHHRWAIAKQLGIDCPTVVRSGLSEEEKRSHARAMNMNRRHLNRKQKRLIIADELIENPSRSNNSVAKQLGVSDTTVAAVRKQLNLFSDERVGDDGKVYKTNRSSDELLLEREAFREFEHSQLRVKRGRLPSLSRDLPLDAIFTWDPSDILTDVAVNSGWKHGVISNHRRLLQLLDKTGRLPVGVDIPWRHRPVFIDNEYKDYDHSFHVNVVSLFEPKYATTRDLMTEQQCDEAEIEFYTFDEIMDFAAELEKCAENVIVIPKFDCIAKIPERYVLGYSVPTSYGGTPLPTQLFAGRRVHLLGGSWDSQLGYLELLGDDVVSLDNNHLTLKAKYGGFTLKDGGTGEIHNIKVEKPDGSVHQLHLTNPAVLAATISLGEIAGSIHNMKGTT